MQDLTILHISDLHMEEKKQVDIRIVLNALFADLEKLKAEEGLKIDFVCFTGDLIKAGEDADSQLSLALNKFIDPLLELLKLNYSQFFIIPGNHDVDRKKVDSILEGGLQLHLSSRDKVNAFLDHELASMHIARLDAFYQFRDIHFSGDAKKVGLALIHKRQHGNARIGFACLDSAWRSSGDKDKLQLIVGERQVDLAFESLTDCDVKIALLHHPLSWLAEHDQRAVRDVLWKFDVVLTGHEHDLEEHEMIVDGNTTMYCACGSLFSGRGPFNGYSIIRTSALSKTGTIFAREYFDGRRRAFGAAERLFEQGKKDFSLKQGNSTIDRVRQYTNCLSERMGEYIGETLMSQMVDDTAPKGIDGVYIPPSLSTTSEYTKERMQGDDSTRNLDNILSHKKNFVFIGKKEIGKTTMLHYIALKQVRNYSTGEAAPFLIDAGQFGKSKAPIIHAMMNYVHEASKKKFHLGQNEMEQMLSEGVCMLLFDNVEVYNSGQVKIIKEFVEKYPNNQFVFVVNENIFNAIEVDEIPNLGCKVDTWYIQTFDRQHVRALITKWFDGHEISVNDMLETTMQYLTRVGLPRTPLIVSMFLAIYKRDQDYVPVNESSVMERFMEMVLEKLAPSETKVGTFDYRSKEKFLSELSWFMISKKQYPLPYDEFLDFTRSYFKIRGHSLSRSHFESLFFEKKVLVVNDGLVYFRYRSMLEYHVALKAIKDGEVLKYVLSDEQIFNSGGIIGFITGLERGRHDILTRLEECLFPLIREHINRLSELDNYNLGLDFTVDVAELAEQLDQHTLSESERDEAFDVPDRFQDFEEQNVALDGQELDDFQKLFNLTLIYGRVLRNSEDYLIETKSRALRAFCLALCVSWAEMKVRLAELFTADVVDLGDKSDDVFTSELIKIVLPIVIQNIASEAVGTPMLEETISACIPIELNVLDFMVVSLYSDLKMQNHLSVVDDYIVREESKDLLRILSFKLIYSYRTKSLEPRQRRRLAETIANCLVKLNGLKENMRGRVIHDIQNRLQHESLLQHYLG